jgi:hypothetical protein
MEAGSPQRHLETQDSRAYAQSRSCYHTERPAPESAFPEVFRVDRPF